ncbi:MAG: polyphosphate kinase 1 [Pseudomonadota bacterium]
MSKTTADQNKVVPLSNAPRRVSDSANFLNRELSILQFNQRVLAQSLDNSIPLLERVRYLSICSNNLDEFFEVRVAGLRHVVERRESATGPDGCSPSELLKQVYDQARQLVHEQYRLLNDVLMPALSDEKVFLPTRDQWSESELEWVRTYFRRQVAPVITPISLDLTHPFPRLVNKSLHFLLRIDGIDAFGRDLNYAVLHMPRSLSRLVEMPSDDDSPSHRVLLLSDIVQECAEDLFPGMQIKGCYQFRLTRDSDLMLDEFEAEDLAMVLQKELSSRDFGASVRLEVSAGCPKKVINFLLQKCGLTESELFEVDGPVNLNRLEQLLDIVNRADLAYEGFTPGVPSDLERGNSLIARIAERDYLLHHPYESFWPVVELVREAAADPQVLAIQQTLYRSGADSPIVEALIDAARAGKEVTAVIELRARFDEAENLMLAQRLQDAGVLVVYGVVGYKTHAKMMLVVRREKKKLKRYVHLGTGNYHMANARVYTDYSLLTSSKPIGEDVQRVFQQLTGMGTVTKLHQMWTAPFTLRDRLLRAIRREAKHAKEGGGGHIVAKMNSLTDPSIIEALYGASQAGVKIDLLVRGVCCLRPGVKGLSENITVRSIVGRFLEHSRVYYFADSGEDRLYCSSADLMERNLDRRVEACFPILQDDLKARLKSELLVDYLSDTGLSWTLLPSGQYERHTARGAPRKVQERLLKALGR